MSAQLARIIEAAIAEGILPAGAAAEAETERPWPVILLTALGAWLAALPLLSALFMLLGEALFRGPGPLLIGVIGVTAAVALLRLKTLPLFVEQLGVPVLMAGGLALGIALFRDLPGTMGAGAMAAVTAIVALLIARTWLRCVLGAVACTFAVLAIGPDWNNRWIPQSSLFALLGVTCLWFMSQWLQRQMLLAPDKAVALAALADGWVLAALAGLAVWSGMTFLAGASADPFRGEFGSLRSNKYSALAQLASLLMAAGATAWVAHQWPSLRKVWSAAAAVAVLALAWLMPSLGAVVLVLAVCATQQRWRLAAAAGVAAAWIIGAFYYQLAFPLATKALIMAGAGTWFGAVAWLALRAGDAKRETPRPIDSPPARLGIAACALAVLAVANAGIWQKETLIAEGKPIFVELAPVDPRSLMQGDYMRLGFRLPSIAAFRSGLAEGSGRRPRVVGNVDARGIAALERLDDGRPLAPGEIAIELTRTGRGWTLVTDAWHFREGEAKRWERARYGEFRVAPDGRALLVGMRGPQLEPITP